MKKYDNFISNLRVLETADKEDLTNEFIIGGIIDKFFIQFELGWKLLKELLEYEGRTGFPTGSPRGIIKAAYSVWDFIDEKTWLDMLNDRNNLTHIYDADEAGRLTRDILDNYIPAFQKMESGLVDYYGEMPL